MNNKLLDDMQSVYNRVKILQKALLAAKADLEILGAPRTFRATYNLIERALENREKVGKL